MYPDRFYCDSPCGLKSGRIQQKLHTESSLPFKKAVEMASGMEAAEASTCPFGTEETTTASVKKVQKSGFHCGNTGHHPNHCCFRSVTCHACKQRGHPAVMCSPKQQSSQGKAFSKVQRSSAGNTKVVRWKTQFRRTMKNCQCTVWKVHLHILSLLPFSSMARV